MGLLPSYDLDLDNRLSEETTVLVENYTVSSTTLHCCTSLMSVLAPRWQSN